MVIKPRIEGEGLENIIIAGATPKIFDVISFDFVVNPPTTEVMGFPPLLWVAAF